jgi:hypothetical protein
MVSAGRPVTIVCADNMNASKNENKIDSDVALKDFLVMLSSSPIQKLTPRATSTRAHQYLAIKDGIYRVSATRTGLLQPWKRLSQNRPTEPNTNHAQDRLTEALQNSARRMPIWIL